jgi:hypothetical protein|uniref:Uncharacterized protein n=1 Tax=candidate division WOR-3 bacterium TaxID=2052148 RepID=A0A7C3YZ10_UNCW3
MNENLSEGKSLDTERINSFIDIFYLLNITWLYIFSLIYPLFGIVVGLILQNAGKTPAGKRVGKICLILGIINIGISIIFLITILLTGISQMARLFPPRI